MNLKNNTSWIRPVAKTGFAAKGLVYCLTGLLVFMSAFHIGGQSSQNSDRKGVFEFILQQPAGKIILAVVTVGLLCYSIWRFIQTFYDTEKKGNNAGGLAKRFTYFFSGITYLSIFYLSLKYLFEAHDQSGKDSKQDLAQKVLEQPAGQILLAVVAAVVAGIGVYQMWYGNSEKYRKHVDVQELSEKASKSLLWAGRIGYISRGVVWLVIAILFFRAALHSNASEAGDSSHAFTFILQNAFGTYILAVLGLGLICYGVFNFIRSAFEKFKN